MNSTIAISFNLIILGFCFYSFQKNILATFQTLLNSRIFVLLMQKQWRKIKSQYFSYLIRPNGTARFKKCKQLFEYKHLLLVRDICWSKF